MTWVVLLERSYSHSHLIHLQCAIAGLLFTHYLPSNEKVNFLHSSIRKKYNEAITPIQQNTVYK